MQTHTPHRPVQTAAQSTASRWGCLRSLPSGDVGEVLVSFGADQWVRLPMSADDAARQGLRPGQCVAVDTGAMPMRLTAVRA